MYFGNEDYSTIRSSHAGSSPSPALPTLLPQGVGWGGGGGRTAPITKKLSSLQITQRNGWMGKQGIRQDFYICFTKTYFPLPARRGQASRPTPSN